MLKQDFRGSKFIVNSFALIQCFREETSLTTVSLNVSKSFPEKKQFVPSAESFILENSIDVWVLLMKMRNRRGPKIDP